MKILLVGNYEPSQQESMQRFSHMIEDTFKSTSHKVKLLKPKAIVCKKENAEAGLAKWLGYIDKFILFKWTLKKESKWADVVLICDHSNAMYSKWIENKPVLVTCHDIMAIKSALGMVEDHKTSFTGKLLQKWIVSGLKYSNHIICVSKNTQEELNTILKIKKEKTSIIYNALNYPYKPTIENEALKIINNRLTNSIDKFFFHLGGNQWYKNRMGVVEIYANLVKNPRFENHKLILAGKPLTKELKSRIDELKLEHKVIELVNLSNEEIQSFYSQAEALIFPSLQEGFGWPIAEAQACGCTVITTNKAPMTEVGGDAAIYISPERIDYSTEIILNNLTEHNNLKEKNLENASRFKTSVMVEAYVSKFNKIIKEYHDYNN